MKALWVLLVLSACAPDSQLHLMQPACTILCFVINSHNEGPIPWPR